MSCMKLSTRASERPAGGSAMSWKSRLQLCREGAGLPPGGWLRGGEWSLRRVDVEGDMACVPAVFLELRDGGCQRGLVAFQRAVLGQKNADQADVLV